MHCADGHRYAEPGETVSSVMPIGYAKQKQKGLLGKAFKKYITINL
jgi:hypothetical protein